MNAHGVVQRDRPAGVVTCRQVQAGATSSRLSGPRRGPNGTGRLTPLATIKQATKQTCCFPGLSVFETCWTSTDARTLAFSDDRNHRYPANPSGTPARHRCVAVLQRDAFDRQLQGFCRVPAHLLQQARVPSGVAGVIVDDELKGGRSSQIFAPGVLSSIGPRPFWHLNAELLIDSGCTEELILPLRKASHLGLKLYSKGRGRGFGGSLNMGHFG